jgi:hypothetical protein
VVHDWRRSRGYIDGYATDHTILFQGHVSRVDLINTCIHTYFTLRMTPQDRNFHVDGKHVA